MSFFALSIDNLKREKIEVDTLMDLAKKQFTKFADNEGFFHNHGIRVKILGKLSYLPEDVKDALL